MTTLTNDGGLASELSMSTSWVRQQRFKRNHNLPHILNIDPVMVGTSPRYRVEDVEAFIRSLSPCNENAEGGPI